MFLDLDIIFILGKKKLWKSILDGITSQTSLPRIRFRSIRQVSGL